MSDKFSSVVIEFFFTQIKIIRSVIDANRQSLSEQTPPVTLTLPEKGPLPEQPSSENLLTYNHGDGDKQVTLPRGSLGRNVLQFGEGITRDMLYVEKVSGFFMSFVKITIKGDAGGSVTVDEIRSRFYKSSRWLGGIKIEKEFFSMNGIRHTINGSSKPSPEQIPPVITPPDVEVLRQPEPAPAKTLFVYNTGDDDKHLELQQGSGNTNVLQFGKGITRDMLHFETDGFILGSMKIIIKGSGSVTVNENRNSKYSGAYYLGSIEVGGETFSMYPIRDAIRAGRQPFANKEPLVIAPPVIELLPQPDAIPPVVITPEKPTDPHTASVMKMIGAHQYKWEKNGQAERKLTYSFNKYSPLQLADYLKKYYPHVYESEMKDNLDDYKSLTISSAENALRQMVRNILTDLQTKIGLEFEEREDDEGGEADTDLRFFTYKPAPGDTRHYTPGMTCMLTADNSQTAVIMIEEGEVSEELVMHEIGHGLGLLHANGDRQYNSLTIMQPRFYAQQFTTADLAVLKEKYGPDVAHRTTVPADKLTRTELLTDVMSGMPQLQAPVTIAQQSSHQHPVLSYLTQPHPV